MPPMLGAGHNSCDLGRNKVEDESKVEVRNVRGSDLMECCVILK